MVTVITVLSYVCYPIILLSRGLLAILLLPTIPIVYIARRLFYTAQWIFHFLMKFETLYIYFGVAVVVGICTGALLHYSTSSIAKQLNLNRSPEEHARTKPSSRIGRPGKKAKKGRYHMTTLGPQNVHSDARTKEYAEWLRQDTRPGKRGLLSTTILEEDDSSEAGF